MFIHCHHHIGNSSLFHKRSDSTIPWQKSIYFFTFRHAIFIGRSFSISHTQILFGEDTKQNKPNEEHTKKNPFRFCGNLSREQKKYKTLTKLLFVLVHKIVNWNELARVRERESKEKVYIFWVLMKQMLLTFDHTRTQIQTSAQWTHYQCPDNLSHKVKKRRDFFSVLLVVVMSMRGWDKLLRQNEWTNQPTMHGIDRNKVSSL